MSALTVAYESLVAEIGQAPHCDSLTLHEVDRCEYCAQPKFERLHALLAEAAVNHAGEGDPGKAPPLDEGRRKREVIDRWGGNRAKPMPPHEAQAWRDRTPFPAPVGPPCARPPVGWRCTRAAGHDGPCAAAPIARDYEVRSALLDLIEHAGRVWRRLRGR